MREQMIFFKKYVYKYNEIKWKQALICIMACQSIV